MAVCTSFAPSRRKAVVQGVSRCRSADALGPTAGQASAAHGVEGQVCLAHLFCCAIARYAVECGDIAFSAAFKRLLRAHRNRAAARQAERTHAESSITRWPPASDRIMAQYRSASRAQLRKRIAANRRTPVRVITSRSVPYPQGPTEPAPSVSFARSPTGSLRVGAEEREGQRASVLACPKFVLGPPNTISRSPSGVSNCCDGLSGESLEHKAVWQDDEFPE